MIPSLIDTTSMWCCLYSAHTNICCAVRVWSPSVSRRGRNTSQDDAKRSDSVGSVYEE